MDCADQVFTPAQVTIITTALTTATAAAAGLVVAFVAKTVKGWLDWRT
jgi:hypothetical protein